MNNDYNRSSPPLPPPNPPILPPQTNPPSFFPIFTTNLYHLLTTPSDIKSSTLSVLTSFATDNVAHLELRTTPRSTAGLTKSAYVSLILSTIAQHNASQPRLRTYLILSIDRRGTVADAEDTVDLALQFKDQGVVGVDLCGDPTRGDVRDFRPAFVRAKREGLKITVHFGEVRRQGLEEELMEILSWGPERLGHVICVSEGVKEEVRRRGCGLELCLSCNVLAEMSEGGYKGHHFGGWWGGRENGVALSVSLFLGECDVRLLTVVD